MTAIPSYERIARQRASVGGEFRGAEAPGGTPLRPGWGLCIGGRKFRSAVLRAEVPHEIKH